LVSRGVSPTAGSDALRDLLGVDVEALETPVFVVPEKGPVVQVRSRLPDHLHLQPRHRDIGAMGNGVDRHLVEPITP
jgi:hypothetical protein